jgi:hypothetical protein
MKKLGKTLPIILLFIFSSMQIKANICADQLKILVSEGIQISREVRYTLQLASPQNPALIEVTYAHGASAEDFLSALRKIEDLQVGEVNKKPGFYRPIDPINYVVKLQISNQASASQTLQTLKLHSKIVSAVESKNPLNAKSVLLSMPTDSPVTIELVLKSKGTPSAIQYIKTISGVSVSQEKIKPGFYLGNQEPDFVVRLQVYDQNQANALLSYIDTHAEIVVESTLIP